MQHDDDDKSRHAALQEGAFRIWYHDGAVHIIALQVSLQSYSCISTQQDVASHLLCYHLSASMCGW